MKYINIPMIKLFKMPNEIISISILILIQPAMHMITDTYPTWQTETYIWLHKALQAELNNLPSTCMYS